MMSKPTPSPLNVNETQVKSTVSVLLQDAVPKTAPIPSSTVTEPTTVTVNSNLGDGVFRVPTAAPIRSSLSNKGPMNVQDKNMLQQIDNVSNFFSCH